MKFALGKGEMENRNLYRLIIGVLTLTIYNVYHDEQYIRTH